MNEMRSPRAKAPKNNISAIANRYDRVALVLQGGGALGAYQIGVYQALAEAECEPSWISGVSIGAINSAIIAGNGPEKRLQNLETFWSTVSGRKIWAYTPEGDIFRDFRNQTSSLMTLLFGQPGFFQPRLPNPWLHLPGAQGATSYYDSGALQDTLEKRMHPILTALSVWVERRRYDLKDVLKIR
jgi:NTE family protein